MEDNFTNKVIELYEQKNWKEITDSFHDYSERNKLLWVFPSDENFVFIKTCFEDLKCDSVLSIGCGCGLLEWMLSEATKIPVSGIEVDGAWWRCKYAPPTFIPLKFTPEEINDNTIELLKNTKTALLFCYFNNGPAFENYLKHFTGEVLFIIGPGKESIVHTDPKPFDNLGSKWKLYKCQEVRNSGDFIAVYRRHLD